MELIEAYDELIRQTCCDIESEYFLIHVLTTPGNPARIEAANRLRAHRITLANLLVMRGDCNV